MSRLLGAAVVVIGVLTLAYGIGNAVGQSNALSDEAVTRGTVGETLAFDAVAGEKLTVYLEVDSSNEATHDSASSATGCTVKGDGFDDSFTGARQGLSTTIGRYVSVGSFTPSGGRARITCRGSGYPMLVTPRGGEGVFAAVGIIIGGAFAIVLGIVFAVVGVRRGQPLRSEQVV